MTTVLLVVLVLSVLYLALRIHQLENAVTKLVRIVNKPRQRDRALGREIAELETDLDMLRDLVKQGAASREDFDQADVIPREARPATRGARRNPRTQPPRNRRGCQGGGLLRGEGPRESPSSGLPIGPRSTWGASFSPLECRQPSDRLG
jgi:DNA-binding protein H-NS